MIILHVVKWNHLNYIFSWAISKLLLLVIILHSKFRGVISCMILYFRKLELLIVSDLLNSIFLNIVSLRGFWSSVSIVGREP